MPSVVWREESESPPDADARYTSQLPLRWSEKVYPAFGHECGKNSVCCDDAQVRGGCWAKVPDAGRRLRLCGRRLGVVVVVAGVLILLVTVTWSDFDCQDSTGLAMGRMWQPTLLSLLALTAPCFAQRSWSWHGWQPGPNHGHDDSNAKVIDLSGDGWTLKSQNGSISIPASIPSQQYIDLYASGTIADPLYGVNNGNLDWVRDQNWTYSRSVRLNTGGPRGGWGNGGTSTYLVFEGLDTFTTISMCGKVVGITENMFRQYTFDITDLLSSCQGAPTLSLNFGPAVPITHEISEGPDQDGKFDM